VKVKVTSLRWRQAAAIEIEGEAPQLPFGPARLGQWQRPVRRRAFDKEIERRILGRGNLDDDAVRSPPGSRRGRNHRETFAGAGATRRGTRSSSFSSGLSRRRRRKAPVQACFGRHAQISTDGVVELKCTDECLAASFEQCAAAARPGRHSRWNCRRRRQESAPAPAIQR